MDTKGTELFARVRSTRAGESSHLKCTGMIVGNFEKIPKRYQDPVLESWLEICFQS